MICYIWEGRKPDSVLVSCQMSQHITGIEIKNAPGVVGTLGPWAVATFKLVCVSYFD